MKPLTNPAVESTILYQEMYPKEKDNTKPKEKPETPNGKIKKRSRIYTHPQLVAEGAETLQAAGREVALVTFKTTPN